MLYIAFSTKLKNSFAANAGIRRCYHLNEALDGCLADFYSTTDDPTTDDFDSTLNLRSLNKLFEEIFSSCVEAKSKMTITYLQDVS